MTKLLYYITGFCTAAAGVFYAMSPPADAENRRFGSRLHRSLHQGVARKVSFLFPRLTGRVDHVVAHTPYGRQIYVFGHVCSMCDFVNVARIMNINEAPLKSPSVAWVNQLELDKVAQRKAARKKD